MAFRIIAEPQGANSAASAETAENKGGMVIYVQDLSGGFGKQEVGRVAFERSRSKYPRVPFDVQIDKEVAKARKCIALMNDLLSEAGELH